MRPTLKTIAEKAGVSPATVSLCLNRHPVARTLSEETRKRIFAVAQACNYRPSYIAKALSNGKTNSIGLVVADLRIERQANFASEIMRLTEERGKHLLIASTHYSKELELESLQSLKERQVDGVIYQFNSLSPEAGIYQQCKRENFPLVKFCRDDFFHHVVPDSRSAMEQAVLSLCELGARRLCGILSPTEEEKHYLPFTESCRKAGIGFELIESDAGHQSNDYSDALLEKLAADRSFHFISLGAYNLFRLQKLLKGRKRLVSFLDEYDPFMELNEALLAGIIFSNYKQILATSVDLLLTLIDRPDTTLPAGNTVEAEFISVPDYKKRVHYEEKLQSRFF